MKAKRIDESTYWEETNPYFPEYNDYWEELVPHSGAADTMQGEILRNMTRIMYDYFNNGFGNDKEDEAEFLEKHKHLFTKYMKDPTVWDHFYESYESIGFGDLYKKQDSREYDWRGYDDEEEEEYIEDMDDKIESMGWDVESEMDQIMDGIVKYVRLSKHRLDPNTNKIKY